VIAPGTYGGVGAGAGGADCGVAVLDLVEEVVDVMGTQPIQEDVAEVRDEMYPNVGFVGAGGAGVLASTRKRLSQAVSHSATVGTRMMRLSLAS
jgi:hypothetical protein